MVLFVVISSLWLVDQRAFRCLLFALMLVCNSFLLGLFQVVIDNFSNVEQKLILFVSECTRSRLVCKMVSLMLFFSVIFICLLFFYANSQDFHFPATYHLGIKSQPMKMNYILKSFLYKRHYSKLSSKLLPLWEYIYQFKDEKWM